MSDEGRWVNGIIELVVPLDVPVGADRSAKSDALTTLMDDVIDRLGEPFAGEALAGRWEDTTVLRCEAERAVRAWLAAEGRASPSSVREEGDGPDLAALRRGLPNPVRLGELELGGRASGYGWRVDSDCGVVKVYSSRDGCMFAVDPQTAREIARAFHAALSDAADVTELRSYGHLYRAGEMTPAAVDAVTRAKEAPDATV